MSVMQQLVVKDAQVVTLNSDNVITEPHVFKTIDCMTVRTDQVAKFQFQFQLTVNKDAYLTGIGSSFETYFNHELLNVKSSFSTSPFSKPTHWQQTLFQFDEKIKVEKGK